LKRDRYSARGGVAAGVTAATKKGKENYSEETGYRCASAETRLEGLGRDAVDDEGVLGLTTRLTDVDDRTVACGAGETEAESVESGMKRGSKRVNFCVLGMSGKNVGAKVVVLG